jgi:hypothetical protein
MACFSESINVPIILALCDVCEVNYGKKSQHFKYKTPYYSPCRLLEKLFLIVSLRLRVLVGTHKHRPASKILFKKRLSCKIICSNMICIIVQY